MGITAINSGQIPQVSKNEEPKVEKKVVIASQEQNVVQKDSINNMPAVDTKAVYNKAADLIQTIVTDSVSDEVISKMPTDEYVKLLSLLDNVLNGSVNKRI